jgi:hypothetical protein
MATPNPPSCNYQSGSGARLYVQEADCSKAPWSSSATFNPSFTNVDSDSDYFVGNFSGIPDLSAGFETVQVFTAAGNGWNSTIKGAASGQGSFNLVMDKDSPLGDLIVSGNLYDFVITFGFTEPSGSDASDKVVGRFRAGKASLPVQLSGEAIMISLPFMTNGPVYGDPLALTNAPGS